MLADVLSRATATSANSNPGDPGIQIVACPSVARELEIIGGYVTAELRADPTLRANDIALWIAGPSEPYVTALPTVWGDAGIPFHLVDASSAMPSRAATALHALLELPFGSASRAELLEVMTNPFVLARCGSTDGDEWIAWTRELGIIAGDDEASHRGTYLEDAPGVFHWRQGLHRLALGALMHVPASNSLDADAALQPRYQDHVAPPHAVAPDRWRSAAMFIQLARSLLADVRWLKTVRASLTAWADIVTTLLSSYLVAPDDLASHELAALHADMASLARLDLDGRELDISELRELVRPRLERGGSRRGHVLSDGVLVAPLAPMRPIPRRRVFIVGLGTGLFPASDQTNSLDLRTTIIAGDVSPRDRDRYAFFESMLGARGPVTLSYVARDAASGDLIEPSSLIYELAEVMTPYLATSDASETLATLTARHPLNRFDDRYLTDVRLAPGRTLLGDRERAATRLRHVMSTHLRNHGYEIPSDRALTTMLERAPQTGILRALGVQSIVAPSTTATQRASSSSLSIDILRKFLVSPIQAWASASLGLVNDVDGREDLDVDDEPRAVDLLVHSSLLTDSIERMLRDGDRNVADVLGEVVALWRARGRYPVGIFGAAANAADRELLTLWRAELLKRNVGRPARFGFGRGNARCTSLLPAVLLHAANRELLLVGATELHHENAGAIITVPGEAKEKHHLRGMFHHVVHAAAGISAELPGRYTLLSKNGKVESIELHPWSQVDARAYLEELATELLTTSHGYLLPLSTAIDACTGKAVELPSDSVGPGALDYGPITHDEDLSMPSVDDAIAMATRRLQPLLARCGVGSKYSDDKPVGVAKPAKVAKASSKKSKPSAAERGDD